MELISLRQENKLLKDFKNEKEKFVKTIKNLNITIAGNKDEIDKKTKQIRDLQRANLELKPKIENNKKEKEKNNTFVGKFDKEKEKALKNLEEENLKLRKEILKLNDDVIKRTNNNLAKFEQALNCDNENKDILQTNNLLISGKGVF